MGASSASDTMSAMDAAKSCCRPSARARSCACACSLFRDQRFKLVHLSAELQLRHDLARQRTQSVRLFGGQLAARQREPPRCRAEELSLNQPELGTRVFVKRTVMPTRHLPGGFQPAASCLGRRRRRVGKLSSAVGPWCTRAASSYALAASAASSKEPSHFSFPSTRMVACQYCFR